MTNLDLGYAPCFTKKSAFCNSHLVISNRLVFLIFALFLTAGLFFQNANYLLALFSIVLVICGSKQKCYLLLVFLLPFYGVFRVDYFSFSFFTIAEFAFIARLIFEYLRFKPRAILIFLALLIVSCLQVRAFTDFFLSIRLTCLILLIYDFATNQKEFDKKEILKTYLFSAFLSGLLGVALIFIKTNGFAEINNNSFRFSGLVEDPNYYSLQLLVGIALSITFLTKGLNKKPINYVVVLFVFLIFGILTKSKSFIFGFLLLLIASCFLNFKIGTLLIFSLFIFALLSFVFKLSSYYISAFDRLAISVENGSIDSITSGRLTIWLDYWHVIVSNVFSFLFGYGFTASNVNGRASHNIYLEIFYKTGLFGLLSIFGILIFAFCRYREKTKRSFANYLGIAVLAFGYVFLSGLFSYELPFEIMICFLLFNYCFANRRPFARDMYLKKTNN